MKTNIKKQIKRDNPLPEAFLEMLVLPEQVFLYLRRGKDITNDLEEQMRHYGLQCSVDFKSPCG